jgi:quaternary ammonium compound-resistance protein SugE
MGWVYTFLASCGELLMIWGLKRQHRAVVFTAWLVGSVVAAYFLDLAFQRLDSSSVYPVWVSIGFVGSLLMGASLYGERLTKKQVLFMLLLIAACIGLLIEGA